MKISIMLLCVVSLVFSWSARAGEPTGAADSLTIITPGTVAPSFSLPSLEGERQVLSVWCGKQLTKPYVNKVPQTVILSFWATYCAPCQKEIPELSAFAKKHSGDPIKIFCVRLDKEGASVVAPFVKEKGYTLPVLLDQYKRVAGNFGVKSLPALVVIDPDGIVRYSSVGYRDDVAFETVLEKALKAASEGKNMVSETKLKAGESVEVKQDILEVKPAAVAPRDRWHIVASVECGEGIDSVSRQTGVPADTIKAWYSQLKESAINLWKANSESGK
jgi:thiol-disulfide isomerase/thioredoxin